jgi:hydrogenase maturation protease
VRRVLVVGCGNPDAGDDAVGIVAVRAARERLETLPGVRVVEGAIGPDLTDLLADTDAAVLVDAVRTPGARREPGTLVRVEAGPDGSLADLGPPLSSHGFGIAEAVALAAALGHAPRVVVVGLEAADVTVGRPLSQSAQAMLPELVRTVLAEAARLSEGDRAPG